jgi:hypothetical protein
VGRPDDQLGVTIARADHIAELRAALLTVQ